ncbi:hypothetical protein F5Y00DRAFT_25727 [Daldinia vernicosa]|uniref:uncharacterized protein n=1 Tax=Daldinia vernicosa TaxID=114800 RepID=UPI002008A5F1|nr:uncharacterized protein F5Y00DRAFT_25727 [Daldinia vernicosa]KAI0851059.1 hypothetical protein F5Y00DRAFT_25727 [Daldinia vernicosa]
MADAIDLHPALNPSIYQSHKPLSRELSLYNGVSNRSRGWKTKKPDKFVEMQTPQKPGTVRWDGASMSSHGWDNLKRDPELWYRDGNCYIHLYDQGQTRRGPAFKVPFSGFLEAACYPFIDRFLARDVIIPTGCAQENGDPARQSRIELFIPAPPRSDKHQSYKYHLATRNFVAYVFRRSMVGENLGAALITLMHSMHQFRSKDVDNVQDLMSYLDEEGYLNLRSNPAHAIAILHLSEVFRLRGPYTNAFAHCCGMIDQLPTVPEYQLLSPVTRKLIRCAQIEMNLRLGQSASLVGNFLRYELAEAHLSLYPGARSHLEEFRSLLHNFYAAKFGSYPPPSVDSRTTIFEADIFRIMRTDFEALYQYLVDENIDNTQNNPFLAEGGVCTWQSIQSFDLRHEFKTLPHPLPLLPRVPLENMKKIAWLEKRVKATQRQQEMTRSALSKATNQKAELLKNGLVRVYCQFEEGLLHPPTKGGKLENLGPIDSRKVRWILIYAVYQALRQATEIPPEVRDAAKAPYHLCISTVDLPPWDEDQPVHDLVRRQTIHIARSTSPSPSTTGWDSARSSPRQCNFEIKPDIDYFAITHRDRTTDEARGRDPQLRRAASWKGSLSRSLSRSLTTRRSSTKLTKSQNRTTQSSWNRQHREIVVQGYGNETNDIKDALTGTLPPKVYVTVAEEDLASASPSRNSSTSDLWRSEDGSIAKTSETYVYESQEETSPFLQSSHHGSRNSAQSRHGNSKRETPPHRPGSSFATFRRRRQGEATSMSSCGLLRRRSKSIDGTSRKFLEPVPRDIQKVNNVTSHIEMPAPKTPTWNHIKIMEAKATNWMANDIQPAWEQYTDLGGLTELRPRGPHRPPPRYRPIPMVRL